MPRRKQPKGPDGRFIPAPTITIDHDDTLGDLTPLPHFAGPLRTQANTVKQAMAAPR